MILSRQAPLWCAWACLVVGHCLGSLPTPAAEPTPPRTPGQELASFHLADPDLVIEPVANEPLLLSPVDLAWDGHGLLYVAEMSDYPQGGPEPGRIRVLEDSDGDGRYDQADVFAGGLSFPTSVLPYRDGLLVTAAPDLLFLQDTNGDRRSDIRTVLWTGFGQGNQQLRVNGLFWGLDHWVYGANGRSDGDLRRPDGPQDVVLSLRGFDFRWDPSSGRLERTLGRSQFGTDRDDWGRRFLSWNTVPVRQEIVPYAQLQANPLLSPEEGLALLIPPLDDGRVYPLTPAPWTFNQESTSHFNALAGLALYRGDGLGPDSHGDLFMGESLRNLVHRRKLKPSGITFAAERVERNHEFLASTDPWFHPVNFATGPDGALYVADFYRRFVEHPDFVPAQLRGEVPWRDGAGHGRIWRIRHKDHQPNRHRPWPAALADQERIALLEDPNAWWRDTAQRLIWESGPDADKVAGLQALIQGSSRATARLQALRVLHAWGRLEPRILAQGLVDRHPQVRRHALRMASESPEASLRQKAAGLEADSDPEVRLEFLLTSLATEGLPHGKLPTAIFNGDLHDRWFGLAWKGALAAAPRQWWTRLVHAPPAALIAHPADHLDWLSHAARLTGLLEPSNEVARCWNSLNGTESPMVQGRLAMEAALAVGLLQGARHQNLPRWPTRQLNHLTSWASATAMQSETSMAERRTAVACLVHMEMDGAADIIPRLLGPDQTTALQETVLEEVFGTSSRTLLEPIYAGWPRYSRTTQQQILSRTAGSPVAEAVLARRLQSGDIRPVELSVAHRQALLKSRHETSRTTFQLFFQAPPRDEPLFERFQGTLERRGDPEHGRTLFVAQCISCHALDGQGTAVGPDLAALAGRPAEAILNDILDPNAAVAPEYVAYSVETVEELMWSGILSTETPVSITLLRPNLPPLTLPRQNIRSIRAEGLSLMPEGLAQEWSQQDAADLLAYLRQPRERADTH